MPKFDGMRLHTIWNDYVDTQGELRSMYLRTLTEQEVDVLAAVVAIVKKQRQVVAGYAAAALEDVRERIEEYADVPR